MSNFTDRIDDRLDREARLATLQAFYASQEGSSNPQSPFSDDRVADSLIAVFRKWNMEKSKRQCDSAKVIRGRSPNLDV